MFDKADDCYSAVLFDRPDLAPLRSRSLLPAFRIRRDGAVNAHGGLSPYDRLDGLCSCFGKDKERQHDANVLERLFPETCALIRFGWENVIDGPRGTNIQRMAGRGRAGAPSWHPRFGTMMRLSCLEIPTRQLRPAQTSVVSSGRLSK